MQSASYKHQKRMSMILSRVNRSQFRDEIISGVQNQEYQVATRSTAAIATSTNGISLISQSWRTLYFIYGTLLPPSSKCLMVM